MAVIQGTVVGVVEQPVPVVGYQPQMFNVTVPEGVAPGQMMQVQCPDGQTVQVQVPMNSSPGTTIQVTPPPPGAIPAGAIPGQCTPDQIQRTTSNLQVVQEQCGRVICRTGPIEWTVKRLIMLGITPIFLTFAILQLTGNVGAGGGGEGGGGGGSFIAGTRVQMADGKWQCIEEVQIGDQVALGGRVVARMEFEAALPDLHKYPVNTSATSGGDAAGGYLIVAGRHAVWEGKQWRRVRTSKKASRLDEEVFLGLLLKGERSVRVFDVDVEKHRLLMRPSITSGTRIGQCVPEKLEDAEGVVFTDFSEVDVTHPVNERCDVELLKALEAWNSPEIEL